MPFIEAGDKANLVTCYSVNDDSRVTYGKNRYLAQTFTIDASTHVWRFPVKLWTRQGGKFYHAALAMTDAYGYPTIHIIKTTTASPFGEAFRDPGKWWRFDFSGMPLLPPGRYALILSVPDAADWTTFYWRCDETAPTFHEGRAFLSHDAGATWELLPGIDFMFMVYGWAPPPAAPPAPAISNWAIMKIEQYQLMDGYKIVATTDSLCHLWLRWTNVKPQIHKEAVLRRGIMMHADLRFCFVAYHENEQIEPEDTLVHTFYKRNWPVCETRWFVFVGSRAAKTQPSSSAVMEKHFAGIGWTMLFEEPWTRTIVGPPGYDKLVEEPWAS
ncbi:unnamed protein product [marine sediment metagenome]|uniref:Uncharacterized protein n=1 Tax=marine sediment metagenome TaxID=412755 RepID=X1RMP2_9ZZZZ